MQAVARTFSNVCHFSCAFRKIVLQLSVHKKSISINLWPKLVTPKCTQVCEMERLHHLQVTIRIFKIISKVLLMVLEPLRGAIKFLEANNCIIMSQLNWSWIGSNTTLNFFYSDFRLNSKWVLWILFQSSVNDAINLFSWSAHCCIKIQTLPQKLSKVRCNSPNAAGTLVST